MAPSFHKQEDQDVLCATKGSPDLYLTWADRPRLLFKRTRSCKAIPHAIEQGTRTRGEARLKRRQSALGQRDKQSYHRPSLHSTVSRTEYLKIEQYGFIAPGVQRLLSVPGTTEKRVPLCKYPKQKRSRIPYSQRSRPGETKRPRFTLAPAWV
jgi:hypothetical protein